MCQRRRLRLAYVCRAENLPSLSVTQRPYSPARATASIPASDPGQGFGSARLGAQFLQQGLRPFRSALSKPSANQR
jgi:hypothetical protein